MRFVIGNMTRGSPSKILIALAVPMVLGNIFQQLYNTTDAIIVGKFIGKNALAAVGVANPIMSVAIFFIFGLCIGTSVLMAQFFGAGDYETLKKEISTALIMGVLFTVALSGVCIFLSRWVLITTGTPEEILDDAEVFLKIIFGGLIFSFLYNYYASVFRAIGDTRTPLVFLIVSCLLNGILCVVFIAKFKLGVAGSAIATVISQGVSSVLCVLYIYFKIPFISLKRSELIMEKSLVKMTIQYSWIAALQQTCLYIGKLLVQGAVNPFGINAIAAYNSVTRVDSFILAPGDSFSSSLATFAAQNKGGGKWDRIIDGYKKANIIITAYGITASLMVFLGADVIMGLFISGSENEVIAIGVDYLKLMSFFYVLSGFCNILQGLFRGVGKLNVTFMGTIAQIFVRVVLSYALSPYLGVSSVCYAIAVGWAVMLIYQGLTCKKYFTKIEKSLLNCSDCASVQ